MIKSKSFDPATRAKIIQSAYDILSGRLGVISGSRLLWRLADELTPALPPEFDVFVGVDAHTDQLDESRKEDHEEWLRSEIDNKDTVFEGCRQVLRFLEDPGQYAIDVARSVLRGQMGIVAGVRALGNCGSDDPDIHFLGVVDSDTDHMSIRQVEFHYRDRILQACRNILEKLERYDYPI